MAKHRAEPNEYEHPLERQGKAEFLELFPIDAAGTRIDPDRPIIGTDDTEMNPYGVPIVASVELGKGDSGESRQYNVVDVRQYKETIKAPYYLMTPEGQVRPIHYKKPLGVKRENEDVLVSFYAEDDKFYVAKSRGTMPVRLTAAVFEGETMPDLTPNAEHTDAIWKIQAEKGVDRWSLQEAPHGYYGNTDIPLIGRDSPSVRGGIQGDYFQGREYYVLVDDESEPVQAKVDALLGELRGNDRYMTSPGSVIKRIIEMTSRALKYDIERTDGIGDAAADKDDEVVPLSRYLEQGVGVCKQQALLAAVLMEAAADAGFLRKSEVHVERNQDRRTGEAHEWVAVRLNDDPDKDLIIDVTNKITAPRAQATSSGVCDYRLVR